MSEELKKKISINMDDLTFGELEEFENVTGLVMSEAIKTEFVRNAKGQKVADPDDPKGRPLMETKMSVKAMMGMVYLSMRRDNPAISFDEIRAMKLSDIDFELTENNETDAQGKEEAPSNESE